MVTLRCSVRSVGLRCRLETGVEGCELIHLRTPCTTLEICQVQHGVLLYPISPYLVPGRCRL